MYIVNLKKYFNKNPADKLTIKKNPFHDKRDNEGKPETKQDNVITEVVNGLTPQTTGAGVKKITDKMRSVSLQNADSKLKKFISTKF